MLMMLASCLLKSAQSLGRWVLQVSGASGAMGAVTREVGFASVWSFGGHGSGKATQLMLMMLASCLLKSAQSLGRWVLQASGASGAMGAGKQPS